MVREWAEETKTPILFLKLDFEKAFDRVNFDYLWQTMERMGLGGKFLQLVKGLVIGTKARVRVNGLYTEEISIERGVRQGDPLAPLLFAISTQPLIAYIDHQIANKTVPTIQIGPDLTICHMLFADLVGIFIHATEKAFAELRNCLSLYEAALGAKLNLQKSVVIPIAVETLPAWASKTGFSIAQAGEVHKYLGAPFGTNLST
jgi:hypothetical protein